MLSMIWSLNIVYKYQNITLCYITLYNFLCVSLKQEEKKTKTRTHTVKSLGSANRAERKTSETQPGLCP